MKKIALLSLLVVASSTKIFAQAGNFKSVQEAVTYIDNTCSKYWIKTLLKGEVSFSTKVYINDCDIYFEQKDFFECKPDQEKPCMPLVLNSIIKVSLSEISIDNKIEEIKLTGGKKAITTLSFDNSTGWDKKGEFSSSFTIPLQYSDASLKETRETLKAAFVYLISKCKN